MQAIKVKNHQCQQTLSLPKSLVSPTIANIQSPPAVTGQYGSINHRPRPLPAQQRDGRQCEQMAAERRQLVAGHRVGQKGTQQLSHAIDMASKTKKKKIQYICDWRAASCKLHGASQLTNCCLSQLCTGKK